MIDSRQEAVAVFGTVWLLCSVLTLGILDAPWNQADPTPAAAIIIALVAPVVLGTLILGLGYVAVTILEAVGVRFE